MGRSITTIVATDFNKLMLLGDISGGKSKTQIWYSVLKLKDGITTLAYRNASNFFTSGFHSARNNGAYRSGVTLGNTWYTIINTTGTKGKLFSVIPPLCNTSQIIDIEITIDGEVHTYSPLQSTAGYTVFLGAGIPGVVPQNSQTLDSYDVGALPGSYPDEGFQAAPTTLYILPPNRALMAGMPYLQWTTDMQVRVRMGDGYWASGGALSAYAAAVFMYD